MLNQPRRRALPADIMKTIPALFTVLLSAACFLTGCQTPPARPPVASSATQATRNNSCSLLHQLLDQQKGVSLLRFIKREEEDVKKLIIKIAASSGAGAKRLEALAKQDPSIQLDDIRLPPGEVAAREAIAATKKKELLGQSGGEFELTLLLTQTSALSYAWHLAKVAAENEPQPDRARALTELSEEMKSLYLETVALLLARTK